MLKSQIQLSQYDRCQTQRPIPLVAEFGTDHIEKAVFVTSASIFSEIVGGMKLKFDEEIEKQLIYQDLSRNSVKLGNYKMPVKLRET